jgi:large subunit ribosomal protein L13
MNLVLEDDTMSQKTYVPSEEEIEENTNWVLFDADGVVLGRLASRIAKVMRGKHKPFYTPHLDCGDPAIVVNASGIELSGKKDIQQMVFRHSQFPGGDVEESYEDLLEDAPEKIVYWAVRGMLPKNKLGRSIRDHLRIYSDGEHPHEAQQPVEYDWENDEVPVTYNISDL